VKEFSAFRPHKKWEGAKRWKEGGGGGERREHSLRSPPPPHFFQECRGHELESH